MQIAVRVMSPSQSAKIGTHAIDLATARIFPFQVGDSDQRQ